MGKPKQPIAGWCAFAEAGEVLMVSRDQEMVRSEVLDMCRDERGVHDRDLLRGVWICWITDAADFAKLLAAFSVPYRRGTLYLEDVIPECSDLGCEPLDGGGWN